MTSPSVGRAGRPPARLLECPVCLGVKLAHVTLGPGPDLMLDACRRCGGIWFDRGEASRLRKYKPKALWKKIAPPPEAFRGPCHQCGALMDRNRLHCPACGRENVITCPVCGDDARLVREATLEVDVCRRCHGVWFDAVELSRIWNGELDRALNHRRRAGQAAAGEPARAGSVLDAMADPFLTVWMVDGAADVAGAAAVGVGDLLGAAPDAAAAVVEGAAGLAESVFEIIAEIIGGLFS